MAQDTKRDLFGEVQKMRLLHQSQILALVATFEQAGALKRGHYKANILALADSIGRTPDYEIAKSLVQFAELLTEADVKVA